MSYSNQPFKSYPKPEKKVKKSKSQMWIDIKKKSLEKSLKKNKPLQEKDDIFLRRIWAERDHICEECGEPLGNEYNKIFADHILEKKKYESLRYEDGNIQLICRIHHSNKHGSNVSPYQKNKIIITKDYFGVD